MNLKLLWRYIKEYENNFSEFRDDEIYKWRAVKHFQDNWDINAVNFPKMLATSLAKTKNLMDSGNYFPRKMIVEYAEQYPEDVRSAFQALFDEDDEDVVGRINDFQKSIRSINSKISPEKSDYQDHRAIIVYLTLRYPDTYFFYKYRIFKSFVEKVELDYKVTAGANSNILQFFNTCEIIRYELESNNQLVKLHKDRIGHGEYFDTSLNILTQDFIYAVTYYLSIEKYQVGKKSPSVNLSNINLLPRKKQHKFTGSYVDFEKKHRKNKKLGDLGENFVIKYEKEHCKPKYRKEINHSAKSEGDGLGFDILSCDDEGNSKYIEVKTTRGKINTPFYISGTELERSIQEGDNYYLYRLYNFNDEAMTADLQIWRGSLEKFCINPTNYEVLLTQVDDRNSP